VASANYSFRRGVEQQRLRVWPGHCLQEFKIRPWHWAAVEFGPTVLPFGDRREEPGASGVAGAQLDVDCIAHRIERRRRAKRKGWRCLL